MNTTDMQHGKDWTGQNLAGWLISEKMDGCRMFWDGAKAWTRQGNEIRIPAAWRNALPGGVALDGELFSAKGLLQASLAVRLGWSYFAGCEFVVFDAPGAAGGWLNRLEAARQYIGGGLVRVVDGWVASSTDQVLAAMQAVQARGGEGLMARHPELNTAPGRTSRLLKVKRATVKANAVKPAVNIRANHRAVAAQILSAMA